MQSHTLIEIYGKIKNRSSGFHLSQEATHTKSFGCKRVCCLLRGIQGLAGTYSMLVKEPDNISLDIKHGLNHSSACKANIIAVCAEALWFVTIIKPRGGIHMSQIKTRISHHAIKKTTLPYTYSTYPGKLG